MFALRYRLRDRVARLRTKYFLDVIFVHINKTGGSSIETALGLPFQHLTALELRDYLGSARWERRFSFAFVRNPWDKVASHYNYRVRTNQTGLRDHPVEFNEWVRLAYDEHDPRYYDQPKMFMPQVDWISDANGQIIVDYVGRFENLSGDFRDVCEKIGRDAQLPHEKQSSNRDYRTAYTAKSADTVARVFARDIAEFGYSFE